MIFRKIKIWIDFFVFSDHFQLDQWCINLSSFKCHVYSACNAICQDVRMINRTCQLSNESSEIIHIFVLPLWHCLLVWKLITFLQSVSSTWQLFCGSLGPLRFSSDIQSSLSLAWLPVYYQKRITDTYTQSVIITWLFLACDRGFSRK